MKKLLFAIAFMTAGSVAVLAQEAQPQNRKNHKLLLAEDSSSELSLIKARIRIKDKLSHRVNYLLTSRHHYKELTIAVGQ